MKDLINGWFVDDNGKLRNIIELVDKNMPIEQIYDATNANLAKGILVYSKLTNLITWNPSVQLGRG